jgi:hypothetical protein
MIWTLWVGDFGRPSDQARESAADKASTASDMTIANDA